MTLPNGIYQIFFQGEQVNYRDQWWDGAADSTLLADVTLSGANVAGVNARLLRASPTPTPPAVPSTGTYAIGGRVTHALTGAPLAFVPVQAMVQTAPGGFMAVSGTASGSDGT